MSGFVSALSLTNQIRGSCISRYAVWPLIAVSMAGAPQRRYSVINSPAAFKSWQTTKADFRGGSSGSVGKAPSTVSLLYGLNSFDFSTSRQPAINGAGFEQQNT